MVDLASYCNAERDGKQVLIGLKKRAQVLKYGRQGKATFYTFRLSNDETSLIWVSSGGERRLKASFNFKNHPRTKNCCFSALALSGKGVQVIVQLQWPPHEKGAPRTRSATEEDKVLQFPVQIPMDSSPLNVLPPETLHLIFCHLHVRQIATAKCVCKALNSALSAPAFLHLLRAQSLPLSLLALKPSHRHVCPHPTLHSFDPDSNQWLRFSLAFLPFSTLHPITSSRGLLYLWATAPDSQKALVVCNPLTSQFKTLPQLGSAWSRHGSVLAGSINVILVLTELAILYYADNGDPKDDNLNPNWLKFSSNLPSKPRSPVLISDFILTLCDVGTPWRPQWTMFRTKIVEMEKRMQWVRVNKREWGDVFDILKRPRLVKAGNDQKVYMVGGLKSSYALQSACTTILILRLDLDSLDWEEVGRMPVEMYRSFSERSKFKVFGGGNRVCFSAKKIGRLVLWEDNGDGKNEWRWIDGVPGSGDGLIRGFVFEGRLDAVT